MYYLFHEKDPVSFIITQALLKDYDFFLLSGIMQKRASSANDEDARNFIVSFCYSGNLQGIFSVCFHIEMQDFGVRTGDVHQFADQATFTICQIDQLGE